MYFRICVLVIIRKKQWKKVSWEVVGTTEQQRPWMVIVWWDEMGWDYKLHLNCVCFRFICFSNSHQQQVTMCDGMGWPSPDKLMLPLLWWTVLYANLSIIVSLASHSIYLQSEDAEDATKYQRIKLQSGSNPVLNIIHHMTKCVQLSRCHIYMTHKDNRWAGVTPPAWPWKAESREGVCLE